MSTGSGGSVDGARFASIHRLARASILKRRQAGGTTLHISNRTYHRVAAIAIMGAVILTGTAQLAQAQATAAPAAQAPAALLKDLDTWAQKRGESDYKDDRWYYYIAAYNGVTPPQPAKVLEVGAALMARDLKKVYTGPKAGPQQVLTVLYMMSVNVVKLPTPSPDQLAIGEKAARALQEFVPTFFTAANKPAGATDAAWTEGRTTMEKVAKDTLMYIATKPGADAMNRYTANKDPKKDTSECVTAEASYKKALEQFPDNAFVAYQLGRALRCQQPGPE